MSALALAWTFVLVVFLRAGAPLLGASAWLPLHAALALLVTMAVAVWGIGASHPFTRLGPANVVTTARTVLVALLAGVLFERPASPLATFAVVISSVAAALDGWDGWLARRTRMTSAFGARFDMEIDALLILILCGLVWRYEKAGAWMLLSGLLRYAFVVAGWSMPWFRRTLPPSLRRKTVCVVQIVGLIVALAPVIPVPLSTLAAAISLSMLMWSFAIDTLWLWHRRGRP